MFFLDILLVHHPFISSSELQNKWSASPHRKLQSLKYSEVQLEHSHTLCSPSYCQFAFSTVNPKSNCCCLLWLFNYLFFRKYLAAFPDWRRSSRDNNTFTAKGRVGGRGSCLTHTPLAAVHPNWCNFANYMVGCKNKFLKDLKA